MLLAAAAGMPLPNVRAADTSTTFVATGDAKVVESTPTANYATTALRADGGSDPDVHSYLSFTVSGLGGSVIAATLRVFATTDTGNGPAVSATSTTWSESTITWSSRPAPVGGVLEDKGGLPANAWVEYDVTSLVTGNGTVAVLLTTTSSNGIDFESREGTQKPHLVVRWTTQEQASTIVAAGDIATCGEYGHGATAALLADIPGVVAALGDLAYESGTTAEFHNCYNPTWGRHKARTRPAVGNHEYQTSGAAPYFAYFGASAGDPAKGYYSYDIGAWHVVVLNSNCSSVGGCGAGSAQEQWLRADLASNPSQCTLAYWHHPLFSSGDHGNNPAMTGFWEALYEAGAEVVLAGHDHHYERFAPQTASGVADNAFGIRSFVVGTGGREAHREVGTPKPNSEVTQATTFGVLRLDLQATGYTWAFVPEAGEAFTDAGTGSCHGAPPPPPSGSTVTFDAAADARVEAASPATNFGTSAALRVDGHPDPAVTSYLRFSVTGIIGQIVSAKLRVFAKTGSGDGPAAYLAETGWSETGITWATKPSLIGSALTDLGAVPSNAWLEFDVRTAVTGNGTYDFALVATSSDGVDMRSREYATSSQRPRLEVMVAAGPPTGDTYAATVLADGPVAYWRLGETSGTDAADTAGTNTGTYTGGVTLGQPGALAGDGNGAARFDGSSGYISVPDADALDFGNGPVTWELWLKRAAVSAGYQLIYTKFSQGNIYFVNHKLLLDDDKDFFIVRESGATTDTNWHHFVITRTGPGPGSTRLYKDGVDVTAEVDPNRNLTSNASPLTLGRYVATAGFYFNGTLDEVAVYPVALSALQVQAHYEAATAP
jgi:hypothetical protein